MAARTKAEFLHYASPYYDPVKAHEYYMRTRELKGRRSMSKMSEGQKEAWTYVKDQVATEKKQKNAENQAATKVEIDGLRSEASSARERITAKLKKLLARISKTASSSKGRVTASSKVSKAKITETAEARREQVRREKESRVNAIPKIPKTASPEQKDRLREQNAKTKAAINAETKAKLAAIQSDATKEREAVSEESKTKKTAISENAAGKRETERGSASVERKKVASKLKTAIESARAKAKEIKEALNAATEATLDREYSSIMESIAGKTKKKK
jgi:hypothetical protein